MTIQVSKICKSYGKQKALNEVSFKIERGELVGFLGPNGAGKSTLMKIITGFIHADSGEAFINEEKVNVKNLHTKKQIGYLPENNPLYNDLYVKEYLKMISGIYNLKNEAKRISEVVAMTGLQKEQHKKIGQLSKGYRQRVGLAQALIHDPSVLILDEPTTGLDPNQLEDIRSLIRTISKDKTVMISTHIMQEVEAMCNRVLIINKGELVADETIDILKSKRIKQAQIVLAEFDNEIPDMSEFQNMAWLSSVQSIRKNTYLIESSSIKDIRPQLFSFAVENNLQLITLQEQQQSLENIFKELTDK